MLVLRQILKVHVQYIDNFPRNCKSCIKSNDRMYLYNFPSLRKTEVNLTQFPYKHETRDILSVVLSLAFIIKLTVWNVSRKKMKMVLKKLSMNRHRICELIN